MAWQKKTLPFLPNEIILIILQKCHDNLDLDVQNYVHHRRSVDSSKKTINVSPSQTRRDYLLYHDHMGYDDCVFWHQCWTYTALRLLDQFSNRHTNWAKPAAIDAMIKHRETSFDLLHPRLLTGPQQQMEQRRVERLWQLHQRQDWDESDAASSPHLLILDPENYEGVLWERQADHVPVFGKFLEANKRINEGVQLLPWQSGYDKAAAFFCIHFRSFDNLVAAENRKRVNKETKPLPPTSYFAGDGIIRRRGPPLPPPAPAPPALAGPAVGPMAQNVLNLNGQVHHGPALTDTLNAAALATSATDQDPGATHVALLGQHRSVGTPAATAAAASNLAGLVPEPQLNATMQANFAAWRTGTALPAHGYGSNAGPSTAS